MAGPNRPDDNPKDFSFLHAEPATSGEPPMMPDSDSFPQLPDVRPVPDASAMPGFTDLNFGDVPFSIPADVNPSFGSSFPGSADQPSHRHPQPAALASDLEEVSPPESDADEDSSLVPEESPQPMLPDFDPELIDSISDDFNADSEATAEGAIADVSFRMASALPSADSFSQLLATESLEDFTPDQDDSAALDPEPEVSTVVKPAELAPAVSIAAAAATAASSALSAAS